jgi:adenosylcobinamide hydrolase
VLAEPDVVTRRELGLDAPVLVWRANAPVLAISSAPLGGGVGVRHWVLNATVPMSYDRDDPDAHLAELAEHFGLRGPGVGLLTGVDVTDVVSADDAGVRVWGTVGLGAPIRAAATPPDAPDATPPEARAAAPGEPASTAGRVERIGTINLVAAVPARLGDAALVNAVATATEAKAQALADLGLPATGTATDAVTIVCPRNGPVSRYGGPRSDWGAPLARAVHSVVVTGGAMGLVPWSDRHDRRPGSAVRPTYPS